MQNCPNLQVLRFVREFVELFEIGSDKTRVGLIQYSDQVRNVADVHAVQFSTRKRLVNVYHTTDSS